MDFFSQHGPIRSFLQIWSHVLEKSLMESFIFCGENFEIEKAITIICGKQIPRQ